LRLEPSDDGVDGVTRDLDRSSWRDVNTNNNGVREFPGHGTRTEADGEHFDVWATHGLFSSHVPWVAPPDVDIRCKPPTFPFAT